jgi:hypothetical protein
MATLATLDATSIELTPGASTTVPLHVRNTGSIVEGYRIEVLGVPQPWAVVEPAVIDGLYPDEVTTATITFNPPRTAEVPAGTFPFGVRVIPVEHPDEVAVPEGVVEVLPFLDTTAELVPRTSHGRRGGTHQVAVDNRGNVPITVHLECSDANDDLKFAVRDRVVSVAPGQATFVKVKAVPRRTMWRGADRTLPFVVSVAAETSVPARLDGTHVQTAILPKWFFKALLAALAILAALAVLWFTLLKPAVQAAAKEAVGGELKQSQQAAQNAQKAAQAAQDAATDAKVAASGASSAAKDAGSTLTDAQTQAKKAADAAKAAATSTVAWHRLEATVPSGQSKTVTYTLPKKSTLTVKDIVLSNPQGDFGDLTIKQGKHTILDFDLENFRDLDYHFQDPITVPKGSTLSMVVGCRQPGAPVGQKPEPTACDVSMSFGGTQVTPAPKKASKD